jgi:hypothetical protein
MASQERTISVAPVSLQQLAGGQAWLGKSGHSALNLGEGGTGLVGRHGRARRRRLGRQIQRQAGDQLPALRAWELVRQVKYLIERWCCHMNASFVAAHEREIA